jgi:hypothetical protein
LRLRYRNSIGGSCNERVRCHRLRHEHQSGPTSAFRSLRKRLSVPFVVAHMVQLSAIPQSSFDAVIFIDNEMDGLREDAVVLFILTTNRPDQLEPALVSRPGCIDQAIEVPLPDDEGRAKLVRLYARGLRTNCQPNEGRECGVHKRVDAPLCSVPARILRRLVLLFRLRADTEQWGSHRKARLSGSRLPTLLAVHSSIKLFSLSGRAGRMPHQSVETACRTL